MIRRPPRSTLFPSPTLSRSHVAIANHRHDVMHRADRLRGIAFHQEQIRAFSDGDLAEFGVLSREHARIVARGDRKSTRLNSSHANISYAVFCLKKKPLGMHS